MTRCRAGLSAVACGHCVLCLSAKADVSIGSSWERSLSAMQQCLEKESFRVRVRSCDASSSEQNGGMTRMRPQWGSCICKSLFSETLRESRGGERKSEERERATRSEDEGMKAKGRKGGRP